ncbi:helix-turn-helix protein [Flavobacterium sp. 1]|jgi:transcriptional regulator with XRE-family HTH domain|uniref:helix-turn-helix transcriptional regulator n=1 Tax=Flavobacterium sp. 1 TaxID=2035200 RepID=UPI000C249EA5|nr:helix-turn-helix transcriptional regulator [Flavobacterium sp. 1]PJJ09824.1 helix-turn-helix protein [Flavobacterium sp. 1]
MEKNDNLSRKFIFDEEGLRLLAKRIKEIRSNKGITQEELSYRSELTLSQIARIETVKTNPTISTVFKIIQSLEVSLNEFFSFDLPPNKEN